MRPPFPPEIWSSVFRELPVCARTQPLLVCRAWREIANATPQLWKHVHITYPHQFAEPAGLSQWLKRSRECPLDVAIKAPPDVTDLKPTLALLHGSVSRFRRLDISAPHAEIANTVMASIALSETGTGNSAPVLEELHIAIDDPRSEPETRTGYFEHAFNPAPRLRLLTLPVDILPAPSSRLLSTITSLAIISGPESQPPSVEAMMDIIAAVPCLKSFKYSGLDVFSYERTYSLNYPRIIEAPHLQTVDITAPGCGLDILQSFHAPNLESVRIDGWREYDYAEEWGDGGYTPVSASLKRLPQRAPCVRTIDIRCLEFLQPETFEWLLKQTDFAQLEELRIEGSTITDAALTHSGKHRPHLRRLELRGCKHITGVGLMAYVMNRRSIGLDDLELLVSECPGISHDHLAQLSRVAHVQQNVSEQ
jgi:hypothetical protein